MAAGEALRGRTHTHIYRGPMATCALACAPGLHACFLACLTACWTPGCPSLVPCPNLRFPFLCLAIRLSGSGSEVTLLSVEGRDSQLVMDRCQLADCGTGRKGMLTCLLPCNAHNPVLIQWVCVAAAAVRMRAAKTWIAERVLVERCLHEGMVSLEVDATRIRDSCCFRDIRGPGLRVSGCECWAMKGWGGGAGIVGR